MSATLEEILAQALQELEAANDLQALDQIRVQYLGKKGVFTLQMKELGKLDPDQRGRKLVRLLAILWADEGVFR